MIELNGVRDALARLTPSAPRFYRAPGRLDLIGGHADYSEGFVLSIAVDRLTVVAAAPRADRRIRLRTLPRDEIVEFEVGAEGGSSDWEAEVRSVARGLIRRGAVLRGADLVARSTIPARAGLAEGAALRLGTALALLGTAGIELPATEIIAACRDFDGAFAPIALALGRRDQALLVDCRTAEATAVPLAFDDLAILLCQTHIARDHAALERERREECEQAARILQPHLRRVRSLRDVSLADFLRTSETLPPLLRGRARHVVTENVRVLQTIAALRADDAVAMGNRLNESHDSLRDDYDLGSPELELLVGTARALPGVYGSRMHGRSGATISLVRRASVPAFRSTIKAAFRSAFGRDPGLFEVRAADGAAQIG